MHVCIQTLSLAHASCLSPSNAACNTLYVMQNNPCADVDPQNQQQQYYGHHQVCDMHNSLYNHFVKCVSVFELVAAEVSPS
jgi:hypothetical protein